jgi:pimeloyl-ACP methyl ester carboxylesterase
MKLISFAAAALLAFAFAATARAAPVACNTVDVDGVEVFYREAGPANAPVLLLLHGFPTFSHMYRELMPKLADRFRVIAPDYPGYGFSDEYSTEVAALVRRFLHEQTRS